MENVATAVAGDVTVAGVIVSDNNNDPSTAVVADISSNVLDATIKSGVENTLTGTTRSIPASAVDRGSVKSAEGLLSRPQSVPTKVRHASGGLSPGGERVHGRSPITWSEPDGVSKK